jgi:RNA polymerase sigma-70 factor, ECF subfamily
VDLAALNPINEKALLERLRVGERFAFEEFIAIHEPLIGKLVASKVPLHDRKDIVQNVFLGVFQSLPNYHERKPIAHWVTRIALRKCYDYWRAQKKTVQVISARSDQYVDEIVAGLLSVNLQGIEQDAVVRARELTELALSQLSAEDRMMVSLVYLDQYSVKDAGQLMGWTVVASKVRLHRGRKKMREYLEHVLARGESDDTER